MAFAKKPVPIEISGYRNVNLLVRDEVRQKLEYRWASVPNTDFNEDDFEPITTEGWSSCPF